MTDLASLRNLSVDQVLETRPTFAEEDRVTRAIGYLKENKMYEVFVRGENRVSGATVRDLLSVGDPHNAKLGNIIYSLPVVMGKDTLAEAARLLFDYRLGAVPVLTRGVELKVVSVWSIMRKMDETSEIPTRAAEIMSPSPTTTEADDTVLKAKSIMTRKSFDHLPVMKSGKLFGVLTSSDVLFNLLPEERVPGRGNLRVRFDYPVSSLAQRSVLEVEPSTTVSNVISEMLRFQSSYALVKLWDEVQGIITLRDTMKLLLPKREKKSPYYVVGLPSDPFEAEAAKMKLQRLASALTNAIPAVREIRVVVKSKDVGSGRRRYEVNFDVYLPKGMHAYREEGYDLPEIFDKVGPKLKRILSSKQSKVTQSAGESPRKGSRSEPE